MGADATVLRDETEAYDDGTVARVRVLAVPTSERFPNGVKYTFHYGEAGADVPIIRFDNHHGVHGVHLDTATYEFEFRGVATVYRAWRAALPPEKRTDWAL